jgi:hypothetical protein
VLGGMLVSYCVGQFADVMPVMTRKKLVQSLVIFHFLYCESHTNCDVIYSRASVEVNRRLNV